MEIIHIVFFVLVFLILYSYAVYPLILKILAILINRKVPYHENSPSISIIISVYNEENVIRKKLENALQLEYPKSLKEILVVSDCSNDNTDSIVKEYADKGVVLMASRERRGKTAGLNDAVARASGEIIVFTDADAMFYPGALKRMTGLLANKMVGLVTGSTQYVSEEEGEMVETSSIYTKLEKFIKYQESQINSCVGADGAIFAMKKYLYKSLKDDDINDLVIPLKVVRQGYRVILDNELVCVEEPSSSSSNEFNRQIRITNRTLRGIFRHFDLFNIFKFPFFSFELLSHKLIRLSVPFYLLLLLPLNIILLPDSIFYALIMIGQIVFYLMAFIGYFSVDSTGLMAKSTVFYHFVMVQIAVLLGWVNYLLGNKQVTWKPGNR
ncbi:MAG TPA: glycosyltransferase [Gammaproteobacteria bacterium]